MRLFLLICLVFLTLPLGAVPSLTDLDSWQIPDEPEPVKQETPKPAPKPAVDAGPEIVIEMDSGATVQGPSRSQSSNEIAILNRSAAQLAKNLAGKSRFYVLFNANTKSTADTKVKSLDGTPYALLLFGQEDKNYRQLLFKYWDDQPLVAVAENKADKLKIFQTYQVNLGLTENDFTEAYPQAQASMVEDSIDHTLYNAYKLDDTFFVVFKEGQPLASFTSEIDFLAYTEKLKNLPPKETAEPRAPKKSIYAPHIPVAPRPKFSDLVRQGTFQERMYRQQYGSPSDEWDDSGYARRSTSSRPNNQSYRTNNSRRTR